MNPALHHWPCRFQAAIGSLAIWADAFRLVLALVVMGPVSRGNSRLRCRHQNGYDASALWGSAGAVMCDHQTVCTPGMLVLANSRTVSFSGQ